MYSARSDAALPAPGFPIRRSAGQRLFSVLPRLIAAVHVLHRLLMPRHPPCALYILTVSPQASCIRTHAGLLPIGRRSSRPPSEFSLAFVQFSSIIEDGRRVIPAPRSLRTEQCEGQALEELLAQLKFGRRFRNGGRQLWPGAGL